MVEFNEKSLLLIGGGGHCRSILPVICEDERYEIAGISDKRAGTGLQVGNIPVNYKDEDMESLFSDGLQNAFIAIGSTGKNISVRVKLYDKLRTIGYKFPKFVCKYSIVQPEVEIGDGTILMPSAVVNPGTVIGSNCIINTSSVIEHDCKIGTHCNVSPGAVICGGVKIDDKAFIGASATVLPEVVINKSAVIGAGAVVTKNIPANAVAIGMPAEYQ
jgi:UDP-perosamine 4-acetyltransferase